MSQEADTRANLALLSWYQDMGVDCALSDEPTDWLNKTSPPGAAWRAEAEPAALPESGQPGRTQSQQTKSPPPAAVDRLPAANPTPARRFTNTTPEAALGSARDAAACAGTLAELVTALEAFDGCGLKATAKNTCVYRGAESARLMIVGEAPGRDEDREGRPFVGRAGKLLDKMLAAIGLDETHVHITNVVYWRPPGNRTPTPAETLICRPFLERQIELVAPEFIVPLGGAAAKTLFNTTDGIMRLRGKWRDIEIAGRKLRSLATLHPAYLLRTPAAKRQAWRDLLAIQEKLEAVEDR